MSDKSSSLGSDIHRATAQDGADIFWLLKKVSKIIKDEFESCFFQAMVNQALFTKIV